jgi:hypothetical protein
MTFPLWFSALLTVLIGLGEYLQQAPQMTLPPEWQLAVGAVQVVCGILLGFQKQAVNTARRLTGRPTVAQ